MGEVKKAGMVSRHPLATPAISYHAPPPPPMNTEPFLCSCTTCVAHFDCVENVPDIQHNPNVAYIKSIVNEQVFCTLLDKSSDYTKC